MAGVRVPRIEAGRRMNLGEYRVVVFCNRCDKDIVKFDAGDLYDEVETDIREVMASHNRISHVSVWTGDPAGGENA